MNIIDIYSILATIGIITAILYIKKNNDKPNELKWFAGTVLRQFLKTVNWVDVYDQEKGLVYHGEVHCYSSSFSKPELTLRNVTVYTQGTVTNSYEVRYQYFGYQALQRMIIEESKK